ncbi:uncharacterized protein LOC127031859 isoform X1 [Gopherus flavomarginatus]|uniref:uncharacterized protein LOC127031859 isoform X1 n=1 Tax=Gopherus flavomarginatus TaxID=286002 RepID=UPI0021CBC1D6|nr:uncharacterized protein LOC127031859 isoform X1 [Gopherus flavomarginatus]
MRQQSWIQEGEKRKDLTDTLVLGTNTVTSAWTIYKTQLHEDRLGKLEQAAGFMSGAQITQHKAAIGELNSISTLSAITQDLLRQMIQHAAMAGKALQWDQACSEIQDYLNTILTSIQKDLELQNWPTALTNTSGVPPNLWPWRHTWKFSGWKCWCSQCSFQAYGPVKGVWAPAYRILPGPWGGCLWDWVIHHDVWEIKPPGGPNRFLVSAPAITPDLWIGLGNLWTYWPLQPPQLQCIRKLNPGEVVTIHHRVCWEGVGHLQDLASHTLFIANNSCVYVNSSVLHSVAFNLHTNSGTHAIYWPTDKPYRVSLQFRVPFNWTSVVPDRFHTLLALLPEVQSISQLQTQIHYLETIYQNKLQALQTAHLVKSDVPCQVTKVLRPSQHPWYVWALLGIEFFISLCLCCWCCCCYYIRCCCCKIRSNCLSSSPTSYTPPPTTLHSMVNLDAAKATSRCSPGNGRGLGRRATGRGQGPSYGVTLAIFMALLVRSVAAPAESPPANAWVMLAQTAINTTSFCLPKVHAVGTVMETCFIGVSATLASLQPHTTQYTSSKHMTYKDLYVLCTATTVRDASMYPFRLANVTPADACVYFKNATRAKVDLTNGELKCQNKIEITYARGHCKLPAG